MPSRTCPKCGVALVDQGLEGLCPKCIAQAMFDLPPPDDDNPVSVPVSEKPGDRIGRYKLIEPIGEGGCGVVYMAEQLEPVRRRVALKVIKLGMDTKEFVARFEAERQVLAMMDHPNIAKVFDAGAADSGRPYFVMELVAGTRITDYCDQERLSPKERLRLFVQVCQAIQHAHQKGVIHRDIKPSNVLVTLQDGIPVPKVIDFGIAKATQQPGTNQTHLTAFHQFIGTPAYMSPEQAELGGTDIDTRSDIYSLGILLYELLTGQPPFNARKLCEAGLEEILRMIREEEPPLPSTQIRSLDVSQQTTVARQRQIEAPKLIKLVRGDLDCIVMKCLEKERGQRYTSCNDLALDIGRHLDEQPVHAAAPRFFYKARKFARRHRYALTLSTTLLVLVSLLAGTLIKTHLRAIREKEIEQHRQSVMNGLMGTMNVVFNGFEPLTATNTINSLRRDLVRSLDKAVAIAQTNAPDFRTMMFTLIGQTYGSLGEFAKAETLLRSELTGAKTNSAGAVVVTTLAEVLRKAKRLPEAESLLRERISLKTKFPGEQPDGLVDLFDSLGVILDAEGKEPEAEDSLREALAIIRNSSDRAPARVANTLELLAHVLSQQGKHSEAEASFREALALKEQSYGNEPEVIASSLKSLADELLRQGKNTEAKTEFLKALAMMEKLFGHENEWVAGLLADIAGILTTQHRFAEAESASREALAILHRIFGNEHESLVATLNNLGSALSGEHKYIEAATTFRDAAALGKKFFGNGSREVDDVQQNLASLLLDTGKPAEAETIITDLLVSRKKKLGEEHEKIANCLHGLARVRSGQGRLTEAESLEREALAMRKKLFGHGDEVTGSLHDLQEVLSSEGKYEEAERVIRDALDRDALDRRATVDNIDRVQLASDLAVILSAEGKHDEALKVCREAISLRKNLSSHAEPSAVELLNNYSKILFKAGKFEEAETAAREAAKDGSNGGGSEIVNKARALSVLAAVLWKEGKLTEAEQIGWDALSLLSPDTFGTDDSLVGLTAVISSVLWQQGKIAAAYAFSPRLAFTMLGLPQPSSNYHDINQDLKFLRDAPDQNSKTNLEFRLVAQSFLLGRQGKWKEAADDLIEGSKMDLKWTPFNLGPLLIETRSVDEYANFRQRLIAKLSFSEDPETAAETAMDLLLVPMSVGLTSASRAAETAVVRGINHPRKAYFFLVKGLAEYRNGNLESAVEWARKSVSEASTNLTTTIAAESVLAMAQFQSNQTNEAHLAITHANETFQTKLPRLESGDLGDNWPQWLIARILLREAKHVVERAPSDFPDEEGAIIAKRAQESMMKDDLSGIEKTAQDALIKIRQMYGNKGHKLAVVLDGFALALDSRGKQAQALVLLREALAMQRQESDPEIGETLCQLADLLRETKSFSESRSLAEEAITLCRQHPERDPQELVIALGILGRIYVDLKDFTAAEAPCRERLDIMKKELGSEHVSLAELLNLLGVVLEGEGKFSEAETLYRDALEKLENSKRDFSALTIQLQNLERLLENQGRWAEAEALHRRSLALLKEEVGEDHLDVACSLDRLGHLLQKQKKLEDAELTFRESLAMHQRKGGSTHPHIPEIVLSLASVEFALGRKYHHGNGEKRNIDEAIAWFRKAAEHYRAAAEQFHSAAGAGEVEALNSLAWFLATCPVADFRDGPNAVIYAERVVSITARKNRGSLDTLAAAYAEVGQFAKAAEVEKEALAFSDGETSKKNYEARLKLYESNRPYRAGD